MAEGLWQWRCPVCGARTVRDKDRSEWTGPMPGLVLAPVLVNGRLWPVSHGYCPEHAAEKMAEIKARQKVKVAV